MSFSGFFTRFRGFVPERKLSVPFQRGVAAVGLGCLACLPAQCAPARKATPKAPAKARRAAPAGPAKAANQFVLHDYAGRDWRNEMVTFPLNAAELASARAGAALRAGGGAPVPYQVVAAGAGKNSIAFLTDLDKFEQRIYKFDAATPAVAATDLKLEENDDTIRLSNSHTGILIRKTLVDGAGPIAGIRLNSGTWVGDSKLSNGKEALTRYVVQVTARGPAYDEIYCRAEWGASQWHVKFRLNANEPVVQIDETGAVAGAGATLSLSLSDHFDPDRIFFRMGRNGADGVLNTNTVWPIKPGRVFDFVPWLHWGGVDNAGALFSVFKDAGTDLLSLAARAPSEWLDPSHPFEEQMPQQSVLQQDADGLHIEFVIKKGKRKLMLSALDKAESLKQQADPKTRIETALPSRYFIKYAHFPLDKVKDWTLQWAADKGAAANYPRLLFTRKDLERFRKTVTDKKPYLAAVDGYIKDPNPLAQFNLEPKLVAWYATGDARLGAYLATNALRLSQEAVDAFTVQTATTYGSAPHEHQEITMAALLADAVLSGDQLTAEQRQRLVSQMAFVSYAVNSPDFWSTVRGYAGFPNMTTSVYGYRATLACLLPTHPLAPAWIKDTLAQLKNQLDTWSDDNGGWLEAPHYAMVAYDQILGTFVMAHNAGLNDYLFTDPKIKLIANWFSKISTPPDSRFGGFRHLPPIGNTYMIEPTGDFGLVAFLFRDKDPAFAAQMQWMYHQQKSWNYPGVGGSYPAFLGYRSLMVDPTIPEKAPPWGSELFPRTGVVLRNSYPSDRETYLTLIAGENHSHYDIDWNAITVWGKGRILADDFGYYGMAPADDHSLFQSDFLGTYAAVKAFAKAPEFDYVSSGNERGGRQIAFVKDADPLAPNYFVVCDSQRLNAAATWRLWLTAAKVTTLPTGALVEGKEDVDMDIFIPQAGQVTLSTEDKTRTAGSGVHPDMRQGAMTTTQTGLIASSEHLGTLTAVLYPRLKTEAAPQFASLAEGKAIKVTSAAGTDYVFLSETPFKYSEGDISFEGTVGLVKMRGAKTTVVLGADGTLSAGGKTVTRGEPHPAGIKQEPYNQVANGDFENGKQDLFLEPPADGAIALSIFDGNPVPDDHSPGKKCLAITFKQASGGSLSANTRWGMDTSKKYKFSVRVYTAAKMQTTIGGYASSKTSSQVRDANGRVWQWSLGIKGPTKGWQTFETTIGPAGSGAATIWPPEARLTGFAMWPSSEKGTVYMDDFKFVEVDDK